MCNGGGWREEPPPHTHQDWKRQRPRGTNEPLVSSTPNPGQAEPRLLIEEAVNKGRRAGKEAGKSAEKGKLPSSLSWGLTVENERRRKVEMWLKGTEKGTTARVMSKCVE